MGLFGEVVIIVPADLLVDPLTVLGAFACRVFAGRPILAAGLVVDDPVFGLDGLPFDVREVVDIEQAECGVRFLHPHDREEGEVDQDRYPQCIYEFGFHFSSIPSLVYITIPLN